MSAVWRGSLLLRLYPSVTAVLLFGARKKSINVLCYRHAFGWKVFLSKGDAGSLLKSVGKAGIEQWRGAFWSNRSGVFLWEALHMRGVDAPKCWHSSCVYIYIYIHTHMYLWFLAVSFCTRVAVLHFIRQGSDFRGLSNVIAHKQKHLTHLPIWLLHILENGLR